MEEYYKYGDIANLPVNRDYITIKHIVDLLSKSTDIVHYCNIDAHKCYELLTKRNVLKDCSIMVS